MSSVVDWLDELALDELPLDELPLDELPLVELASAVIPFEVDCVDVEELAAFELNSVVEASEVESGPLDEPGSVEAPVSVELPPPGSSLHAAMRAVVEARNARRSRVFDECMIIRKPFERHSARNWSAIAR
jgi:hypothetical protein